MAKVTITITDMDEDRGTFAVATEFDPPISKNIPLDELEERLTNAQKMALMAVADITDAVEATGGKAEVRGPSN